MDVSKWSLDQIMMLPEGCFGRRWPVVVGGIPETDVDRYYIVRTGVPDRGVVWEIIVTGTAAITASILFELAWADQVPTTAAEWSALQKMFPCQGVQDGLDMNINCAGNGPWQLRKLRLPSPAAGLRPALRIDGLTTTEPPICATFVFSSLPTEVPDCLLSV